MKIQSDWLNTFLSNNIPVSDMAKRLERVGVEVEQIISSNQLDKNIIVARVKKVIQHPNADRLKLADVETGGPTLRIVCGAPNVREGLTVALAQVGTVLPDGTQIKAATIRGEESQGMLCSAQELGLNDDHSGLLELDPEITLGTTLCDIMDSGQILDLTTSANRPDLLSAIGLAREIAAAGGEVAQIPEPRHEEAKVDSTLVGTVEKNLVRHYTLAHVKLGKTGESPVWMKSRLQASGLRPINVVVDITNYVMLETGQPLHAFDANNVTLPVDVRSPRSRESLVTLDGTEQVLTHEDLLIADARGPLGLAGVMGGLASQIIDETNEIYLEAANFDGATIRRMALRHGLRSDASARFERNLPLPLAQVGLDRALELLIELCDADILALSSQNKTKVTPVTVSADLERINQLLGMVIKRPMAQKALEDLGFEVTGTGSQLTVVVPWWRTDVSLEADVAEEIGRIVGYDNLPATLPAWHPTEMAFDGYWSRLWQLKSLLRGLGIDEVVTYSFISHKQLVDFSHEASNHLKLANPMSVEQAYLRSRLGPSLVATVGRNWRLSTEFGVWEISRVFVTGSDHSQPPAEPLRIGVIWYGKNPYAKVKNVIDSLSREFEALQIAPRANPEYKPGLSAQVFASGIPVGWIGELHPDVIRQAKINGQVGYLEIDVLPWLTRSSSRQYQAVSKFPQITRDLSLVVAKTVLWADIEATIVALNLAEVTFVSQYYGAELPPETKSLTLRLTFSSETRTLREAEADAGASEVLTVLTKTFGAKLRS